MASGPKTELGIFSGTQHQRDEILDKPEIASTRKEEILSGIDYQIVRK